MSSTTATDIERKNISVWFECKSCQFTFPFRTVAEFLDHKKQKHLAEFQKAQCIVFEERLQDERAANYSGQISETTKLFAQDDDVEFCTGRGTGEILFRITELSHLKTFPLPVPVPVSVPVLNQVLPPPLNLSDNDDSTIQATDTSAVQENTLQNNELNTDFGLFSICLPSVHTSRASDPCDLEAGLILNDSTQIAVEAQLPVHILVDVEHNSAIISPDNLSPDFSFLDDHDAKIDVPIKVVVPSNVEVVNNNYRNFTSSNPYVSLRRLSAKELLGSNRSCNPENILKSGKILKFPKPRISKVDILRRPDGPFTCTICSKSCSKNSALGAHINTHYAYNREPRQFKCSYPHCPSSFKNNYNLKRHTKGHESASTKPSFKFPLSHSDTVLPEGDPLTLREWLIQQKFTSEKSNDSSEITETVNIIRLDPDPSEMDEATDKTFKISGVTPIKCKLCNKNLESEAEVKVHVMHCWLRNKKRHIYCVPCNKALCSRSALKSHRVAIHAEQISLPTKREHKCHICLRPYKTLFSLKIHLISHKTKEEREREASFVCEICGKGFIYKHVLLRHIVSHGENRPFKCSYPNCTAAFKFNSFLQGHLKTHLPKPQNVPKLFCCPKEGCSKRFRTKTLLRLHLNTILHTGEPVPKSWKCDQENCDKLYAKKESLNRHMIAAHGASGEIPTFACQICNQTFTWKSGLTTHLRSHTGEKPFKCSYYGCEKAYKQMHALKQHLRGQHTGERPFQCELCGKAYYGIGSLKWHMGLHRKSQAETK